MNRVAVFALLAFSAIVAAQAPHIRAGATVFIEPMGGYETYLAAAIVKSHVPLVVAGEKGNAEYLIQSTVSRNVPSTPQVVVNNSATATINEGDGGNNSQAWNQGWESGQQAAARRAAAKAAMGYSTVSIAVVDIQTKQIIFAFSSTKDGSKQVQKTAEDCVKHLKEFIGKSDKSKK